jgi:putative oxidoreductase
MATRHHATLLPFGPARARPFFEWTGPATHVVFRVVVALLFMQHGVQKLFGWFGGVGPDGGTVQLASLPGIAGMLEVFGGALILIGLLTRPIALLLVGEMVAAYIMAHMPQGGFPIQNHGELALLYAASFLFLMGNGAGPWSLDHWLGERRARRDVHRHGSDAQRASHAAEATRRAHDSAA